MGLSHRFLDLPAGRALPASARLATHPTAADLAARVHASVTRTFWGIAPEQFHRTGRFRQDLQRGLADALKAEQPLIDELLLDAARWLFPDHAEVAVQAEPYARAVPPHDADAVKPFHVDAYIGHPKRQLGLWIPIADIEGDEGLWLVPDDVTAPFLADRPLGPEASDFMRRAASPLPMRVGEVLVLSSTTGHGGVVHTRDRTRVSFDVRIAPVEDAPRGRLGWRSRVLRVPSAHERS